MYGYIYKTTNLINNKIYIGQHKASQFEPEKYIGSGKLLTEAINKYGVTSFKCELIDTAETPEDLNDKEIYYIKLFNACDKSIGYNIASGGAFGDSGYHLGMLGKSQGESQKKAVSKALKGKPKSDTAKQNMSIKRTGITYKQFKQFAWVTNEIEEKRIHLEDVAYYLSIGYRRGKLKLSPEDKLKAKQNYVTKSYIHKNEEVKLVDNSIIHEYLAQGWEEGKGQYGPRPAISKAKKGAKRVIDENGNIHYIQPEKM